jgi:hypothetical protein
MPVETGMIPDDEVQTGMVPESDDVLDAASTGSGSTGPPPDEIASVDVIVAEAAANEDGGSPVLKTRGEVFALRSKVPGMLLMQLSKAQADITSANAETDFVKQSKALVKISDVITKLIAAEDRDRFIEWSEDTDPPLEMADLMELVGEMMTEITGRPTEPASE